MQAFIRQILLNIPAVVQIVVNVFWIFPQNGLLFLSYFHKSTVSLEPVNSHPEELNLLT